MIVESTENRGNILVVDDTPANLNVLSALLTQNGYKVRPAISGELALTAVRNEQPDLILLDIRMPGLTGYEVCERLKSDEQTRSIPVIFITALDDVEDKVKGFQVGGVDYITKPFHIEEVLVRVENQLALVRQRQEIMSLNLLKDELVRVVSHDLKTPISVIIGYISLLATMDEDELRTELKVSLGRMMKSARYMNTLVTDLLDLAVIEEGMPLNLSPVSLGALLADRVDTFELLAQEQGVQLQLVPVEHDVVVHGDENRLGQVINNLLSNAIKFTSEGGLVTAQAGFDGGYAVIQVADTGIGIPVTELPYIFDKFRRVKTEDHQKIKGSGLGLSIVKAIVEQHGGKVFVESEWGKGSIFTVALPI